MALRTAEERRRLIKQFKKEHPDRALPVEIAPPGMRALKRATKAQIRDVARAVERHQAQLSQLSRDELHALAPIFAQAERELEAQLKKWIEETPDGELRWTAQSYRAALLQIKQTAGDLEEALHGSLDRSTKRAQRLAIDHLKEEVARFSAVFEGTPRIINVKAAAEIATARAFIIPKIKSSAARYAWGRGRVGVAKDIQNRLAVDILKGETVSHTVDRLVEHGGPRGAVALQGVLGEENAIVEVIPEGLFRRYRWWAERIVRTETTSAYGAQAQTSMQAAAREIPDLKRQWFADATACVHICQPMAGQIVGLNEPFITGLGDEVMYGGAHPCCGCVQLPYRADWPVLQ